MNHQAKLAVLTGLNLAFNAALSLGAHASDLAGEQPAAPGSQGKDVLSVDTRELETSFLKVAGPCKASHAAFEAVSVGLETVPAEIRRIHAEIETA